VPELSIIPNFSLNLIIILYPVGPFPSLTALSIKTSKKLFKIFSRKHHDSSMLTHTSHWSGISSGQETCHHHSVNNRFNAALTLLVQDIDFHAVISASLAQQISCKIHGGICLQTFSDHSSAVDVNNEMIPIDFSTPECRVTTKNKARTA